MIMYRQILMAVLTALAVALHAPADAGVRLTVPEESPHAPLYADWYGNDEWVAFIFYRDPGCVNTKFNVLEVFDDPETAFNCPLTVEGFEIYKDRADRVPRQTHFKGIDGVPIWFISRDDYQDALKDEIITIVELNSLPSLMRGSASFFSDTLHPFGGHKVALRNIEASGIIPVEESDLYESFRLHALWVDAPGMRNINVRIRFR